MNNKLRRNDNVKRSTIDGGDEVPVLRLAHGILQERHPEDLHHPVQQPMNDLESSFSIHIHRTEPPIICSLSFRAWILHNDVGDLEDLHGQGERSVLASGLEHAWEEGSSDDLIFEGFRVG